MSTQMMSFVFLALLVSNTDAAVFRMRGAAPHTHHQIAPNNVPYKKRCSSKKSSFGQVGTATIKVNGTSSAKFPGVGADRESIKAEFAAGETYKDGFYNMGCIKDYMYYKGDKFGDNKYDYELEQISNVSIVFPESYLPKEDREPMTVSYCYSMCRQLKDMNFFGIVNGLKCYCTPYVKQMAADNTVCSSPCDGDTSAVCGSKTKSSIFQMHACDDGLEQLTESTDLAANLIAELEGVKYLTMGAALVSERADKMKEAFGLVGDPEVSNLFQASEAVGSEMRALASKIEALNTTMSATHAEGVALKAKNLTKFEDADKADSIMAKLADEMVEGEKLSADMLAMEEKYVPSLIPELKAKELDAAKQYYPIMYFEDKKFEKSPTSCGGELLNIYLATSLDGCARQCDVTDTDGCIGFLYVPGPETQLAGLSSSFCFTFTAITSMQYYTKEDCPASSVMCYGKLSKLSGTTPLDKEKGQKAVEADSRCMPSMNSTNSTAGES